MQRRYITSAIVDADLARWLRDVSTDTGSIETPGEAFPSRFVDYYCLIDPAMLYPPIGFLRDQTLRDTDRADVGGSPESLEVSTQGSTATAATRPRRGDQVKPRMPPSVRSIAQTGEIQLARRKLAEARATFENGLVVCEEAGVLSGVAQMLTNLGRVNQANGDIEDALQFYEKAIRINRDAESPRGEAIVWSHIGSLYETRDPEKARSALLESLAIEERLGDSLALCYIANTTGRLLKRMRDLDGSASMFAKAAASAARVGHQGLACRNLGDLGTILRDAGDLAGAKAAYTESLQIANEREFRFARAILHDNLGRLAAIEGDDSAAEFHFRTSLAFDEQSADMFGQAKSHANLGVLLWLRGLASMDRQATDLKTQACVEWKKADDLFRRSSKAGGRIEVQSAGFLRKLSDIRSRADRATRGKVPWNDLFF